MSQSLSALSESARSASALSESALSPSTLSLPSHPISNADHLTAMRGVVSSAWHGLWQAVSTTPWIAIAVMIPAVALLVGCTRASVRRD